VRKILILGNLSILLWKTRKEDPPPTLNDKLSVLFTDLVVLADMFRRQAEVDKLEKQFGK